MNGWDSLIEPLIDAYVKWKYPKLSPLTSPPSITPNHNSQSPSSPSSLNTGAEHEDEPHSSAEGVNTTCEPQPSGNPHPHLEYSVQVFEIFNMEEAKTILRPPTSTSVVVDLAEHGFLGKTPIFPNVAVGFRTLELFHRLRLRKASYSVEAFTRLVCDYYVASIIL